MTPHTTATVGADTIVGTHGSIGAFAQLGVDGDAALQPLRIGAHATVRSHAVIYRGTTIGDRFHAGHGSLIREETVIGDDVSIGSHSIVEHHVAIEHGVRIHGNVFVPEHSVLEAGCWIGPSVTLTNARYPNRPDTKANLEGVRIGSGAVIGAGAVLLPGVAVGRGAIVGAGAVIVRDVPSGATVVGNPGRQL